MADTYVNTTMQSSQITSLMRRINALESSIRSQSWVTYWNIGSGTANCESCFVYNGEVYISDPSNDKIRVYNLSGVPQRNWGTFGTGAGELRNPQHIWAGSGEVYVADADNSRIQVYNTSGTYQRQWAAAGSPEGVFVSSGDVYVARTSSNIIHVYDTSGVSQRSWSTGAGTTPSCVFVYSGSVYVTCRGTDTIKVYNTTGTLLSTIGSGELSNPDGIYVGVNPISGDVNIWVTNATSNRVKVFDESGALLDSFGESNFPFSGLSNPQDIHISGTTILVSDIGDSRINVFDLLSIDETTFYSYTTTAATSLGTPDGGVSVPALAALTPANNNADLVPRHIIDMRTAIETLAPYFTNAVTGNPFNWTASSADNLYYVAMGDRTEYGATGGAAYDWTRTEAEMEGDYCYSIDIGEIDETVSLLEAS